MKLIKLEKYFFLIIFFIIPYVYLSQGIQSITFNYTGAPETWTVPSCVSQIQIEIAGAKGGGVNGGNGAIINGYLTVVPGQTIQLNVGGEGGCPASGFNGAGSGSNANNQANASCGGGGSSDLRTPPYQSSDRIIVAAGGGGMGGGNTDSDGGGGGCANGGDGTGIFGIGGDGANQNNGGNGGAPWSPNGNSGVNGVFYNGGIGASDPCFNLGPGGGGGGGYYGGGGGGSDCFSGSGPLGGGGGGGGSSLVPLNATCISDTNSGNGYITITFSLSYNISNQYYLCPGESVQIGSNIYTSQGVYSDTLQTISGCDSIINSIVFIYPQYSLNNDITICSGTSYSFNGVDYDIQGSYSETLQSINGCDSIVNFNLFIEESSDTIINETICTGSNFNFNGQSLFDSGQYIDTLLSVNGCDSVVFLSLFVTPAEVSLINETICDDSSYMFNNLSLTSSGVYYDTLVSSAGCDSISSLYLNVVSCEFEISNILTPNNDGQNDTWMINDLSVISNCEVRVYNRWGQIVFESSDYQNDWNGTKSGEDLPDGIYFYSIIGTGVEYTGSINLLRLKK